MNTHSFQNPECIHEINLALFEEICRVEEMKRIIRDSSRFKNFIAYYRLISTKNAAKRNDKEKPPQKFLTEKDVLEAVDFAWGRVSQKILHRRVVNKDEIIEDWHKYLVSAIDGILRDEFWSQSTELRNLNAGVQYHPTIRTKQTLERNKDKLVQERVKAGQLSEKKLQELYDLEKNIAQIKALK